MKPVVISLIALWTFVGLGDLARAGDCAAPNLVYEVVEKKRDRVSVCLESGRCYPLQFKGSSVSEFRILSDIGQSINRILNGIAAPFSREAREKLNIKAALNVLINSDSNMRCASLKDDLSAMSLLDLYSKALFEYREKRNSQGGQFREFHILPGNISQGETLISVQASQYDLAQVHGLNLLSKEDTVKVNSSGFCVNGFYDEKLDTVTILGLSETDSASGCGLVFSEKLQSVLNIDLSVDELESGSIYYYKSPQWSCALTRDGPFISSFEDGCLPSEMMVILEEIRVTDRWSEWDNVSREPNHYVWAKIQPIGTDGNPYGDLVEGSEWFGSPYNIPANGWIYLGKFPKSDSDDGLSNLPAKNLFAVGI